MDGKEREFEVLGELPPKGTGGRGSRFDPALAGARSDPGRFVRVDDRAWDTADTTRSSLYQLLRKRKWLGRFTVHQRQSVVYVCYHPPGEPK